MVDCLFVNATEFQNNFGKYLQIVQNGGEVVILKNGREAARLISAESSASFLTDSMAGVLKKDYAEDEIRKENRNEGMLSESEYGELLKLKHNEAYLSMLDASLDELSAGNIISKPQTE